jgi:PKD domain
MPRMRLIVALVAVAVVAGGCWGSGDDNNKKKVNPLLVVKDPFPGRNFFHTYGDANRYAGPTPLTVQFKVDAWHETGKVKYRWRFDDGTTSTAQFPKHTFKQAGTYTVVVDAIDQGKHNDRWNLVLGVWPVKVWNARKPIEQRTKNEIKLIQRQQARRTQARLEKLQAAGLPTGAPRFKAEPGAKAKQPKSPTQD